MSARLSWQASRMRFRSWPAAPTKGSPCRSSSAPGASPMNMIWASGLPTAEDRLRCESWPVRHTACTGRRVRGQNPQFFLPLGRAAPSIVVRRRGIPAGGQAAAAVAGCRRGRPFLLAPAAVVFGVRRSNPRDPGRHRTGKLLCGRPAGMREEGSPDMNDILPKKTGRFRATQGSMELEGLRPTRRRPRRPPAAPLILIVAEGLFRQGFERGEDFGIAEFTVDHHGAEAGADRRARRREN